MVEDEAILSQHLQEFLSQEDFEVVGVADSAESAFPLVLKKSPDLLLLDVHLQGGRSGIYLAEKLKKYLDIPVVFLTSSTDFQTIQRIKRLNIHGFVTKPFDESHLKIVLELAIAKHQQEKVRNAYLATEDFFYYLSHNIRGALSRILGLVNLVRLEVNDHKFLYLNELIEKDARKVNEYLTNYFHYVTTIDYKEITYETIYWNEVIAEVLQELEFKEKNRMQLPFVRLDTRAAFSSDEFLIKVILTQILKNTLDFKKEVAEVQVMVVEQKDIFQLKVLDKGIGMNAFVLKNCLNLYFRGTEVSEGIGIGLNLAQKAVERLNGKMKIVSVEGKGTCVIVTFPRLNEPELVEGAQEK